MALGDRYPDGGSFSRLRRVVTDFTPQEENNESFAPDAPELAAAERISDLFGEDSTTSVMQVIVTAENGEVFSPDGLTAVNSLTETIMNGALADRLVQDRPDPVVSFLTPVRIASAQGAPRRTRTRRFTKPFTREWTSCPPGPPRSCREWSPPTPT